ILLMVSILGLAPQALCWRPLCELTRSLPLSVLTSLDRRAYEMTLKEFDGGHEIPAAVLREGFSLAGPTLRLLRIERRRIIIVAMASSCTERLWTQWALPVSRCLGDDQSRGRTPG